MNNLYLKALPLLTFLEEPAPGSDPAPGGGSGGTGSVFENVLKNVLDYANKIVSILVVLLGVAMIIFAAYHITKALASRQRAVNWTPILMALLLGGMFAIGGFGMIKGSFLSMGYKTALVLEEKSMEGHENKTLGALETEADKFPGYDTFDSSKMKLGNDGVAKAAQSGWSYVFDDYIIPFGKIIVTLAGVAFAAYGCFILFKATLPGSQQRIPWAKMAVLFLIGGFFLFGGEKASGNIAKILHNTASNVSTGVKDAGDVNMTVTGSDGNYNVSIGDYGIDVD